MTRAQAFGAWLRKKGACLEARKFCRGLSARQAWSKAMRAQRVRQWRHVRGWVSWFCDQLGADYPGCPCSGCTFYVGAEDYVKMFKFPEEAAARAGLTGKKRS